MLQNLRMYEFKSAYYFMAFCFFGLALIFFLVVVVKNRLYTTTTNRLRKKLRFYISL